MKSKVSINISNKYSNALPNWPRHILKVPVVVCTRLWLLTGELPMVVVMLSAYQVTGPQIRTRGWKK